MNRLLLSFASLTLVAAITSLVDPAFVLAQDGRAREEILALDKAVYDACQSMDGARIRRVVHEDFFLLGSGQTPFNRDQFVESCTVREGLGIRTEFWGPTELEARLYGDTGITLARVELRQVRQGEKETYVWIATRTYAKVGAVWQLVAEHRRVLESPFQ